MLTKKNLKTVSNTCQIYLTKKVVGRDVFEGNVVKRTPSGRYVRASVVVDSRCVQCGEPLSRENTIYCVPLNREQKLFKSIGCQRCKGKESE